MVGRDFDADDGCDIGVLGGIEGVVDELLGGDDGPPRWRIAGELRELVDRGEFEQAVGGEDGGMDLLSHAAKLDY
jgi:hypothetical protein